MTATTTSATMTSTRQPSSARFSSQAGTGPLVSPAPWVTSDVSSATMPVISLVYPLVPVVSLPSREARYLPCGSAGDPVEGVGVRPDAPGLPTVQPRDGLKIVNLELEAEDVEVLTHPRHRHRLGKDDIATLHVPTQHDL